MIRCLIDSAVNPGRRKGGSTQTWNHWTRASCLATVYHFWDRGCCGFSSSAGVRRQRAGLCCGMIAETCVRPPQTLSSEYYRSDRNSAILHVLGIYSHRSRNYLDRYFSDCFCHLGRRGGVQTDNAEPQLILLRSCWSKIVLNASNQSIGQGNQLRLGIRLLITTILAGLGALLTPILQNSSCRGGRPTKASACQQHAPRRSSGLIANKRLPLLFM